MTADRELFDIIDGTHIVDQYLGLIKGRSISQLRKHYDTPTPCARIGRDDHIFMHSMTAITWFVQIVADNTLHLLLLYCIVRWLV